MRVQKLIAVLLIFTLLTSFLVSCNAESMQNAWSDSPTHGFDGGDRGDNNSAEDDSFSPDYDTQNPGDTDPDSSDPDDSDTDVSKPDGNGNQNGTDPDGQPTIDRDAHTDDNSDGKCDDCGISVLVALDFYAINDLHGKFADTDSNVGVDELTTYLRSAYKTDDNAILLSSGDMWQGSFESNATRGLIVTDWMNDLDFVSMTLGNHEYDWGEEYVEANVDAAEFSFLAINIYDRDTNERVDYCKPSVIIERGGMKIGIIGAMGDCYSSISADKVEDVYFKTGSQLTALVKAESDRLRAAGADYIVYSIHDGHDQNSSGTGRISSSQLSGYYDASLSRDDYVDLVFEGHTHKSYVLEDEYGVYHLQNGGDNKGISHAEVKINFVNGDTVVTEAEFVASSRYSRLDDDPIVDELMEKYADVIQVGAEVLGRNGQYRNSTFIRKLVATLYYEVGVERWGDKYNLALGGGFISVRSPYNLSAGDVTYADLNMLLPFDNQLVLCSIKGRDLKSKFFETTNSNYFIDYGEYGAALKNNIDLNATYYIITDTYCSSYKYNNLTVVEYYDAGVYARDLIATYIREGKLQ
ncbi:MAG: 5'-nucleotidase C-terminal domain-containing protein [Clostridia bacterium]|nr:5'-nucleotidase C-terminal domain-containing protein [Clostridia bacterium]